jgi:hypothetical protein
MSMMFDLFDRLMSSQEDSLAKIYPWLDDVLALVESGAGCGGSSIGLLGSSLPPSFSSKTSLACYRPGLRPLSRQVEYRAEKNADGEWCWSPTTEPPSGVPSRKERGRRMVLVSDH